MNWIIITIFLVSGVLIGENIKMFFAVCFLGALLLITLFKIILKRKTYLQMFISLIAFCLGVISVNSALIGNSLDDYMVHYVNITGTVISAPQKSGDNYKYIIDTDTVSLGETKIKSDERILLTAKEELKANDTVIIGGFLKHITWTENEYGFNSKDYYKSKDIEYKIYSDDIQYSDAKLRKYYPAAIAATVKGKIYEMIYEVSEGDNAAIFNAVLTGNKSMLSDELKKSIEKSGAVRYIYNSYFFIMLCMFLVNLFSENIIRSKRTYILMAMILIISVLNSDKPVFIKASLYMALLWFTEFKFGFVYKPDILCIVIIAIMLTNPLIIYDGGFVISVFASVLTLIFVDSVKRHLYFIKKPWVRSSIAVGLICTIGLLPLTAYYFNGISLYSVFLVFIYVPVNILIWICFFPAFLMMKLFGTAPVFSQLLNIGLFAYKELPGLIMKLPFAYIPIAVPGLSLTAAFYLLLTAAYFKIRNKSIKLPMIASAAFATIFIIIQIGRLNTIEMTFVNVGQGDGAVVSVPYRDTIIIDGGGGAAYSDYNPGAHIFVPYLKSHGKTKIDAAFISHFHKDHVQGVIEALKECDVEKVYIPDFMADDEFRIETETIAKDREVEICYIDKDTELEFKSGMKLEITVPDERIAATGDENDTSLLINVKYGDVNCLFTGDMTKYSENALLEKNKVPQAEVLKVAHHGSATSTGEEWVRAVNPDISVISLGEDNIYDFPRESVLEALKETEIYRTDKNGDITVIADKEKIKKIKTYK